MLRNMLVKVAMVGATASCFLPTAAMADEWNKETIVTFRAPVEVPGHVLPAGKYVFEVADTQANRDIVEIFNADRTHLIATILAVPDYRLNPIGKTIITFEERAAGAPEAIRSWFYPGDTIGIEFRYPKVQSVRSAVDGKASNCPAS
jgi:hypothetical protein